MRNLCRAGQDVTWQTISYSNFNSPARKFNPLSVARAFAIKVFEQPGGPYSNIPFEKVNIEYRVNRG